MCDERTASKMTAFNTAKRNGLTGVHIIQLAQLQQYWVHGLASFTSAHTAHLQLPTAPRPPDSAYTSTSLPAPTLMDLLNPLPAEEELLFNPPDPYGVSQLDNDDADDVAVSAGLDIDDLVDLKSPKLQERYSEVKPTKASVQEAVQPTQPGQPWSQENWDENDMVF